MTRPDTAWHASDELLARYRGGDLHGAAADSVEAHLLVCPACRQALAAAPAPHAAAAAQEAGWERIAAAIDRPSRWSRSRTWVRLAVGTPQLATAAAGLALAFLALPLLVAAMDGRLAVTWYLALAPSVPLAGTLVAYRAVADPVGALAQATPLHSFRIVVMRVSVLLGALLPAGALAAVLLPGPARLLLAWVLPGLAASATVLAVGARRDPLLVGVGLCAAWAVAVAGGLHRMRVEPLADALAALPVTAWSVQLASVAVTVLAAAYVARHRDDLAYEVMA